ncbi:MafI family immunity protein [Bacteroides sp. 519]|uniref:MafI family immunity protein n=1 Tax=Bacteroides sp. 519 TaxID=2302937 RepID=UPI0013D782CF|nr:MafI family immunity protein [Bacteroides sp. 519]NDV60167.1 hypothetical protein [Bacteroides sp. 519]
MKKKKLFELLFKEADKLGLPQKDLDGAKELFEYNEQGLALDIIVTQLFEYQIPINQDFFNLVNEIAIKMEWSPDLYLYIKELIK